MNDVRTLLAGRGLVESPRCRLVIVSSAGGRLMRREPNGSLVTHADLGTPGWNDIVVDGRGHAYVNRAGFNPVAGAAFRPGFVFWPGPTARCARSPMTSRCPTGWR
jgi:sugar lactone lactonase YvrE